MTDSKLSDLVGAIKPKMPINTKLLSDFPASEDEFGTHKPIADAIAEMIENEEGGKSIGLEGGWGSGKSTVVNLLQQRLENNENFTVILFDAWAHQGDPLRRTFLETITKRLREKVWVTTNLAKDIKKKVSGRYKKTTTNNSTVIHWPWGVAFAITTLLVPIGLVLLSSGLDDGFTLIPSKLFTRPIAWKGILGIIGTISPLLVLLVYSVFSAKRDNEDEEGFVLRLSGLLSQDQPQETITETVESPDPTSVEFQRLFFRLIGRALDKPERRLVIVLDNLDRVLSDNAISLLSTLQTFLHHHEYRSPKWFERLWVLIPYDPRGLKRLWEQENGTDGVPIADAFLDKNFQIRFEVPPLLISNWRSYLMERLEEAFPDHDSSDYHKTYRVYDIERQNKDLPPTPRDIKLFVNQIGTIYRQRGGDFPLQQMAYYAMKRRINGEHFLNNLRLGIFFKDASILALLGDNVQDNLAAMAFNTEVSRARQLLLEEPLMTVLGDDDGEELKKLEANYSEGFWEVLEKFNFDIWGSVGLSLLSSLKSRNARVA